MKYGKGNIYCPKYKRLNSLSSKAEYHCMSWQEKVCSDNITYLPYQNCMKFNPHLYLLSCSDNVGAGEAYTSAKQL